MSEEDVMISVLKRLGVSFEPLRPEEHRHYRFVHDPYMPLVIEQWAESGRQMMSVTH